MGRIMIAYVVLSFSSFLSISFAQDKMMMVKVADDVYMMENSRGSGNSTFVITGDGAVVFDTDIRTADPTSLLTEA